ncbi:ketopantoate reductase C-terminal domain-containing protein, partial [Burkholderia pseudomallei]
RRTEIDALHGAVVAAAGELGVAVPHVRPLLQLVRLIDAQGG